MHYNVVLNFQTSSIIHARIPSDAGGQSTHGRWDPGHPLYEHLQYPAPPAAETHSAPGSRRSSLILMTPKPFTRYQDKTARPFRSELELNSSQTPQFDVGLANKFQEKVSVTSGPDKQYQAAEGSDAVLPASNGDGNNTYISESIRSIAGESNPYENDYPRNPFGSLHQMPPGQLHTQPFSLHARSQSDISGHPGLNDVMEPTQTGSVHEQPTSEGNTWHDESKF